MNVWASKYQSNLKSLIILKKRVIRIITRSAFDAQTEPLFKKIGILNLENIYKLQIGKFMYLYKAGLLPDSFNNMFSLTNHVHQSYETRSSGLFYLPYCITNVTSVVSFNSKLKAFLLT